LEDGLAVLERGRSALESADAPLERPQVALKPDLPPPFCLDPALGRLDAAGMAKV